MSEIKKLQENINVKRIDENTVLVHVAKNEIMMALAGEFNENFKLLEKVTLILTQNTDLKEVLILIQ